MFTCLVEVTVKTDKTNEFTTRSATRFCQS
jgi:hypothetical protein